jgi:hypothetical protein
MKKRSITIGGLSYELNYSKGEDKRVTVESLMDGGGNDCKDSVDQNALAEKVLEIEAEADEEPAAAGEAAPETE